MKKFTKFLSIFLALTLIIGMMSVVGAVDPETPTAPAAPTGAILQGTVLEVVSPTKIETQFGFYEDFTGEDPDTFLDCEDGACVTDGWFGRAGYSECTSEDGLIAAIMTLSEATTIGGIEIVVKNDTHDPTDFTVEAWVDGGWVELVAEIGAFDTNLTRMFTFDAVETDTVRILINEVDADSDDGQCYLNEVTLFTPKTGNLKTVIDMSGKVTDNDANGGNGINNSVDGDKSTFFTGSTITVDLGEATAIDGFNLYYYRSNAFPNNITVKIQKTEGGEMEEIGTFATGFTASAPQDSLYVTFDQTYMAYAVQFISDVWGYQNDYELWQYQREATEPEATEPEATEPEATEPEATEPEATEPEATEPAPAPEYTWIDLITESELTPHVGYYVGDDYTTLTDECPGEAEYLTDARVSTGSWVHGNTFPVPSGKTPAAVVEVGGTRIIAGVYMSSKPGCEITDFVVEVLNTNNEWVTVNTTTGNTEAGVKLIFDNAVVGTAVRVIINGHNNDHPMMQELWVYEGLNSDALVQIPVINVTASQDPVVAEQGIANVVDGGLYTYYQIGAGNMPVAINFDTTNADGSATNVSRMRIYAFNNSKQAAKDIIVDVKTSNEPETWETVYTGVAYELEHTDTFVLDFGATYAAFDVRLTINTVTRDNLVLTEVELFGNGEPVAPPVVTPTEPTEPEATEPEATEPEATEPEATEPEATEPEATEPAAEALPEAPVVLPGTTTIAGGVVKEGSIYKLVSTKKITTGFGYYNASGTFIDKNDGVCVTDGWYGRSGYSECTSADGQIALIMTLDEVMNIGRVEIVARTVNGAADNRPVDFEIQALVDGDWVTVTDVNEDPFTNGMTVAYTFPAVATNQVRILINEVVVPTNQCHLNEVELYEVTTGKLYNNIDLTGKIDATDAHESAPANQLIDGDKDKYFLGANVTFNLTDADGNPTSVDGFRMFHYRGNQGFASNVSILVQTTPGGEFVALDSFATNWMNTAPQEQVIVEFAETVVAYGMQVNLDNYSYVNELELFQYEKDAAPVEPPVDPDPTTPTEPGETPTEPGETPTEPGETPTEPGETPTEPGETPTEPGDEPVIPGDDLDYTELDETFALLETMDPEDYTEESMLAFEEAFAEVLLILMDENLTQEMVDEANEKLLAAIDLLVLIEEPGEDLPEVPELPGLTVDVSELQATIDLIHGLNPNDYTEESYMDLVNTVKKVNLIIAGGNYTQELIDDANAKLVAALDALVEIDGGNTDVPGGDDLPADTGDIALTVLSAMMAMSAVGGAVVIGKKKFF